MASDLLSDALGVIRARVVVRRLTADETARCCPKQHTLTVHAAMSGGWRLSLDGRESLRLDEGDVVLSRGALAPCDACDGAAGIAAHIQPDELCRHLLAALPRVVLLEAADPAAIALRDVLDRVVRERENPGPGAEFAGEKYGQLLLVEVLRVGLGLRDAPPAGWLRVFADPELQPALTLMHERPAHPWRLADLAHAVSMSRSTFATRFRSLSGIPPLTYLHHWRIRLAQAALRDTDVTVAALAGRFGYASESSFSHAFSRTAGVSPRHYRNRYRPVTPSSRSGEPEKVTEPDAVTT